MENNTTYKILYLDSNHVIEAVGPLLKEHSEEEYLDRNPFGLDYSSRLVKSQSKYFVRNLKIFDSKNRLIKEFDNYLIYELNQSGPCLSIQQETLHGDFPIISQSAFYISMFDEYNQELTRWMPENRLSWDNEKRILTIL